MRERARRTLGFAALALGLLPGVAGAEVAVVSNDAHTALDREANQVAAPSAAPDTVAVVDLSHFPPKVAATVQAPGSVVGPPTSVWVAPDDSWAITTGATRADPAGISPDNRVSVIDLASSSPRVVQQVTAGAGATTVRVSPDGSLALVCNRAEGSVSVFTVRDKRLAASGKLDLGKQSGPSGLVFSRDGKTALVSRNFDNQIAVLHVNGTQLEVDKRPLTAGVAPYTMDITADGKLAAVSNMGRGNGDIDTVSLIDMTADPIRVVETVSVGLSPEGLKFSPDGKFLAVGTQNGTTKPPNSPFFHQHGTLILLAVSGSRLERAAEAPIGRWSQGIAFSRDGTVILVEDMVERALSVFHSDGHRLTEAAPLPMGAGPAGIGRAWP